MLVPHPSSLSFPPHSLESFPPNLILTAPEPLADVNRFLHRNRWRKVSVVQSADDRQILLHLKLGSEPQACPALSPSPSDLIPKSLPASLRPSPQYISRSISVHSHRIPHYDGLSTPFFSGRVQEVDNFRMTRFLKVYLGCHNLLQAPIVSQ